MIIGDIPLVLDERPAPMPGEPIYIQSLTDRKWYPVRDSTTGLLLRYPSDGSGPVVVPPKVIEGGRDVTDRERFDVAADVCALLGCDEVERSVVWEQAVRLREDAFGRSLRDNLIRVVVINLRDRAGKAEADLRACQ